MTFSLLPESKCSDLYFTTLTEFLANKRFVYVVSVWLVFGADKAIVCYYLFLPTRFELLCLFAGRLRSFNVRLSCAPHASSGSSGKE